MVDFGITLDNAIIAKEDVIRRLIDLGARGTGINHTSYPPLRYCPLVLSVETKASSSDDDNAHVQLALWSASQYKMLRKCRYPTDSPGPLPTLPLISTYKSQYVLHYAVDQEDKMVS